MSEKRLQRPLTDAEMIRIETAIQEAGDVIAVVVAALTTTFDVMLADFGESWLDYSAERTIDRREYAIPHEQWSAICEELLRRGRELDPDSRISLALEWMDKGPSPYIAVVT